MRKVDRYTAGHGPRGPFYIPIEALGAEPKLRDSMRVCRYWPVLTPDDGIIMCSTEDDAARVADDMNAMMERITALEDTLALWEHAYESGGVDVDYGAAYKATAKALDGP